MEHGAAGDNWAVLGLNLLGAGAFVVGSAFRLRYARLLGLRGVAELELRLDNYRGALRHAQELLQLAPEFRSDWYYGNAIHHAHLLIGEVAFRRGDLAEAGRQLVLAAATPGSPQLRSFGPSMRLARLLLDAGEREVVIEYLEGCRAFWGVSRTGESLPRARVPLERWIGEVRSGTTPDFGANLVY